MRDMGLVIAGFLVVMSTSCRSSEDNSPAEGMATPIRSLECVVNDGMQDAFLASVDMFSRAEVLEMDAATSNPARGGIVIQMVKEDYEIVAVNPFDAGNFRVHFYYHREGSGATQAEIDRLVREFSVSVSDSSNCRSVHW